LEKTNEIKVAKGRKYTVDITGLNHEGQGVGRIARFTVFIEGAIPGERVEAEIAMVKSNYCTASIARIIIASDSRVESFCGVYGDCGGCSLQHIDYSRQLELKTGIVKDALQRIGKIDISNIVIHDTVGMSKPLHYRNKAQYPVGPNYRSCTEKPGSGASGSDTEIVPAAIGFYSRMSHDIVDFRECAIHDKACDIVKEAVREFIKRHARELSIYDEATGEGLIRHIAVRVGSKFGEVMAIIVINGRSLPRSDVLIRLLLKKVPRLKSVFLNINMEKSNIIFGEKFIRLYGQAYIEDHIGKYVFRLSPASFYQVNPERMEYLYNKAIEYAGLTGTETVADIYCGIGTITLLLAEKAMKVYGIEVSEDAVKDARLNASLNEVTNVEFICAEAEAGLEQLKEQLDVIVLDPPRKGCAPELLNAAAGMMPEKIIYISCNPSTLARDLAILQEKGFRAVEVQPVDMFPHTAHVEVCCLLCRRRS